MRIVNKVYTIDATETEIGGGVFYDEVSGKEYACAELGEE